MSPMCSWNGQFPLYIPISHAGWHSFSETVAFPCSVASSASWNMQNIPVQRVGTSLPSFSIVPDPCYIPHRIRSLGFSTTSAALFLCNGSNTMYTKMSLLKIGSNLTAHQRRRCCLYIFTYLYIHIYIMKYCSAIKNEILPLVIILMGL